MAYESFAQVYDVLMEDVDYVAMAGRLAGLIQAHGQKKTGIVLDLACGTGSLTLALKRLGFDMIGVDSSEEMLMRARDKAQDEDILYLCQDMRDLDLYGTVDAVVSTLDSLNHLDGLDALRTVFERVSLFLEPGGVFLFDMNTPYKHREVLADNTFVYDCGPVYCVWQNDYEEESCTVQISLDLFFLQQDGRYRRTEECFTEHAYSETQIQQLVLECGLEFIAVEGEDGSFSRNSQRGLWICRKPAASR